MNFFEDTNFLNPILGIIKPTKRQYQIDLLETFDREPFTIIKKGRQLGISTLLCYHAANKATKNPEQKICVIIPFRHMISNFRKTICSFLENETSFIFNNENFIQIKNGSRIDFLIEKPSSYCSYPYDLIIWDEAAYLFDFENSYYSLFPCLRENGQIIISSTKSKADDFFINLFKKAEQKINSFYPINLSNWELGIGLELIKGYIPENIKLEFNID